MPQTYTVKGIFSFFVPGAGIEPAQYCYHWCLRPARLPVPPSGQLITSFNKEQQCINTQLKWMTGAPSSVPPSGLLISAKDNIILWFIKEVFRMND